MWLQAPTGKSGQLQHKGIWTLTMCKLHCSCWCACVTVLKAPSWAMQSFPIRVANPHILDHCIEDKLRVDSHRSSTDSEFGAPTLASVVGACRTLAAKLIRADPSLAVKELVEYTRCLNSNLACLHRELECGELQPRCLWPLLQELNT